MLFTPYKRKQNMKTLVLNFDLYSLYDRLLDGIEMKITISYDIDDIAKNNFNYVLPSREVIADSIEIMANSNPFDGLVLMALAIVTGLWLFVSNVRRTNVLVGTTGSAIQASVYGASAGLGVVAILVAAFGFALLVGLSGARPVYVLNRW